MDDKEKQQNGNSQPVAGDDRTLLMAIRRARLLEIDALERELGIAPRTSQLRDGKDAEDNIDLTS